jgi:hypothetical protein
MYKYAPSELIAVVMLNGLNLQTLIFVSPVKDTGKYKVIVLFMMNVDDIFR